MRITTLRRYPVKSLGGCSEVALEIEPWGPAGDRRWAIVDESGNRVSAREHPMMLSLAATTTAAGSVRITTPSGVSLDVAVPVHGEQIPVGFSRLPVATDAGRPAAEWLSDALGRPVRLVWQSDPTQRSVNPANGGRPGEVLSLADAGPLLLTSESSLAQLQTWVGEAPVLSMLRFRPSVVIDGESPFAEDNWQCVRLGDVVFRVQQTCDRCVMTTIDPVSLEKGPEPIRTLSRHRKWDGQVWFGVWLVPRHPGTIHVGDRVGIASTAAGLP